MSSGFVKRLVEMASSLANMTVTMGILLMEMDDLLLVKLKLVSLEIKLIDGKL